MMKAPTNPVLCRIAALVVLLALSGCAEIVSSSRDEVQVDTGQFGELAPGTRQWISWLQANEHCSSFGRKPKLIDLRGSVAVYRCVVEE